MSYDHTPGLMSWLETVEEHYGSLDNFPDGSTIHILRQRTNDMILENELFIAQVKEFDVDTTPWEEDLVFLRDLKTRLDNHRLAQASLFYRRTA